MDIHIHPAVDAGIQPASTSFSGGTLTCSCASNAVVVTVSSAPEHSHLCGCTKCWKPEASLFSIVAVVPKDNLKVVSGGDKLDIVDAAATIQRHVCKACGVHMYGRIEINHAFHGLDFIHPELFNEKGWPPPNFAAFVSSIIESGTSPNDMSTIRSKLKGIGLEVYDCLTPELMDIIADYAFKN